MPELKSKDRTTRGFEYLTAINTPNQGSAADIIKDSDDKNPLSIKWI
ncbi:MAG: hypothetical protein ACM3SR_16935 [Ignavibacteriales bacterium]